MPKYTPVDYDPFAPKGVTYTPVDYDPFQPISPDQVNDGGYARAKALQAQQSIATGDGPPVFDGTTPEQMHGVLGKTLDAIGREVPRSAASGIGGLMQFGVDMSRLGSQASGAAHLPYLGEFNESLLQPIERGAQGVRSEVAQERQADKDAGLSTPLSRILGGVEEGLFQLPEYMFPEGRLGRWTGAAVKALPAAAEATKERYTQLVAQGMTPADAAKAAAVTGVATEAGGIIPMGASGNLATRAATSAPVGVAQYEATRRAENAVLPDSMQQPFDPEAATVAGVSSAALGAAFGHKSPENEGFRLADEIIKSAGVKETPVAQKPDIGNPTSEQNQPVKENTESVSSVDPQLARLEEIQAQQRKTLKDQSEQEILAQTVKTTPNFYPGDVETMRASLKEAGLPQGSVVMKDGQPVGLRFGRSVAEKVAPILSGTKESLTAEPAREAAPVDNTNVLSETGIPVTEKPNGPATSDVSAVPEPSIPHLADGSSDVSAEAGNAPLGRKGEAALGDVPSGKSESADVSRPADYTPRFNELRARRGSLSEPENTELHDLYETDRTTAKMGGKPMLGVKNRVAYEEALAAGKLKPAQVFTDADNFKSVNDKLGHNVGDNVLRDLGDAYKEAFGEGNVHHFGGDEFVPQADTPEQAHAAMEQVRAKMAAKTYRAFDNNENLIGQRDGIGISYGVGKDKAEAEHEQYIDKARRAAAGLRTERATDDRRVAERTAREPETGPEGGADRGNRPSEKLSLGETKAGGTVESARTAAEKVWGRDAIHKLTTRGGLEFTTVADAVARKLGGHETPEALKGAKGFYDPKTGKAHVLADNVAPENVAGVVSHEVFHANGEKFLGDSRFKALKTAFGRLKDKAVKDAYAKVPKETPEAHRDEEAMAYLVEDAPNHPASKRIVDQVKLFLNRMGIPLSWLNAHDAAVREIARQNLRHATEGSPTERTDTPTLYSKDQTDTPEFKKWFGDSKVVDEEGKPKVVYHGTTEDFNAFNTNRELGAHFGTKEQAENRLPDEGEGSSNSSIFPAYLTIKNPLRLTDKGFFSPVNIVPQLHALGILPEYAHGTQFFGDNGQRALQRAIEKAGYDGIVYSNSHEGTGDSYIAFHPEQIKSAIGNTGAFDPKNPDIRYSKHTPEDDQSDHGNGVLSEEALAKVMEKPRAPGESREAYTDRITSKDRAEMKAAIVSALTQRKVGRGEMRAMWAKTERALDVAQHAFEKSIKYFDKQKPIDNLKAIDQWETGDTVSDPHARLFFEAMKQGFDERVEHIRELSPGALQDVIENYFPHLWEDPTKAAKWYQGIMSKRPLQGNKSFLKQRYWGTIREGIEAGLKPASTNPVDLVISKMAQMDKYIAALEFKQNLEERGWVQRVKAGERLPVGYAVVEDPAFRAQHAFVVKGENGAPDTAGTAHFNHAVPEMIARDINNYLSPSLYRFGAFKVLRTIQNLVMSMRLGWSGFHAGFTTVDNAVMHVDVAARQFLQGDVVGGLKTMMLGLVSPAWAPFEGGRLGKQWVGKNPKEWIGKRKDDPNTQAILDALELGGARRLMSTSDYNRSIPKFRRAIWQKDFVGTAKNLLPAVGEASSYLIHHKLVPAQKMAARVLLMKFELDRVAHQLGKGRGDYSAIVDAMHPDALKQIAGSVVDAVDNRLGQMAYDNQFWNKTARELAQVAIGAVGWQVGTVRTVTGGLRDVAHLWDPENLVSPLDKAGKLTGENMERFGRLSYLLSLALTMGGSAAALQYMLTGQAPTDKKDYFFPKTGRKNLDGSDERVSFPSYWMDHYKLATSPLDTAEHKIHPTISMFLESLTNKDYYGTQIHDPEAPWYKQAEQIGEYVAKGFLPYTITGIQKSNEAGTSAGKNAAQFFGVASAPASMSWSPMQTFIYERNAFKLPELKTLEQAEKYKAKKAATIAMTNKEEVDKNHLTKSDLEKIKDTVAKREKAAEQGKDAGPIADHFKSLSFTDKMRAYELASPEEVKKYDLKKLIEASHGRLSKEQKNLYDERFHKLLKDKP